MGPEASMEILRLRLRDGWIVVPPKFGINDIYWRDGLDYQGLDENAESFKWWLACLGLFRLLFVTDHLSSSDEFICKFVILDWHSKNNQVKPAMPRSWDAHAAALRTEIFIEIAERAADSEWLNPIISEQMEFLARPQNFQGNWNHGVDQARALVLAATYLDHGLFRKLGLERLRSALNALVDEEGVTIEQSVHYQLYNFEQIERCLVVLRAHGISDSELATLNARQRRMPSFLAHATRPDGTYFEIGDTPFQSATPIKGTTAEYAATQGRSGQQPDKNVAVYKSGYVFGRSGWGTSRPFSEEGAYAIRFGAPRIIHGHNDHMSISLWFGGREILRDGGFHGYTDDADRAFLRLAEAHNSVVPVTKLRFRGRQTELVERDVRAGWQHFRLTNEPYDGVRITRSFLISFDFGALVVSDAVSTDHPLAFEQRWFLGLGLQVEEPQDRIVEEKRGVFGFAQHLPCDSIKILNPENNGPMLAGRAMYELVRCASIYGVSSGREVRFLTTFAFGSAKKRPQVATSYDANRNRNLVVGKGPSALRLVVMADGSLIPILFD